MSNIKVIFYILSSYLSVSLKRVNAFNLFLIMFHFEHPFTAIVAGPSGCGKSNFVCEFLKHMKKICSQDYKNIMWCYDEMQPLYNLKGVEYYQGIPDLSMFDGKEPQLIIIDDLMRESDGRVVDIFTKGSHHRNLSVFYITQNLFHQGKGQRDISLNSSYIIYFKNPRDKTQIRFLSRQLSPENVKFVEDAYRDATSKPHGYLMIDLKQNTDDMYRFKTNIFPNQYTTCYIAKKGYKYMNRRQKTLIPL